MTNNVAEALIAWYDENARVLPWRGFHDAYRTWISEIMLQQTRVDTVIPYYHRFLGRCPTLEVLAKGPEEDVLKAWEGLGYYSRARNLLRGARQVMAEYGGRIPEETEQLIRITGIGPYTAGAIASIAYDRRVPAVDGNVIRVLSRVFGIREDAAKPDIRRRLEELAGELVPASRPGDYNQSVMDLGATICVPGTPDCEACPLQKHCDAYAQGDAAELPVLPQAKPPRVIQYHVLLLRSGERFLLRQRTEKMLQGLWVFPLFEADEGAEVLSAEAVGRKLRLPVSEPVLRGRARHVFTHQIWEMTLWAAQTEKDVEAPGGYAFVTVEEFDQLTFPVAMKAAVAAAKGL